jgi:hypothetical protein
MISRNEHFFFWTSGLPSFSVQILWRPDFTPDYTLHVVRSPQIGTKEDIFAILSSWLLLTGHALASVFSFCCADSVSGLLSHMAGRLCFVLISCWVSEIAIGNTN